jgi:purine-cytosine permease-like protein
MISLRVHNILDYVIGAFLVLSPSIFGFSSVNAARDTFLVLGFGLIGYSLLTDYRYSIAKLISLGIHMFMDVILGAVLMIAPWVFGYRPYITSSQTLLHFVLGLGAWGLVALTNRRREQKVVSAEEEVTIPRKAA